MKIIKADVMGFCFGVDKAVELTYEILKNQKQDTKNKSRKIYVLGMLVHNEYLIEKLKNEGVLFLEEKKLLYGEVKLNKNDIVIIRAHGTTKEIYEYLKLTQVAVHNATCYYVEVIKKLLIKRENRGDEIIFLGDKNHPEVKGIISFGKKVSIFSNFLEFQQFNLNKNKTYTLLTQTTFNKNKFDKIKKYIEKNFHNINFFDKICNATYKRQKAVEELSAQVDTMLVIGSKKSSNTKKLYEISKMLNSNTYLIQQESDIDFTWFKNANVVGITAGASTPNEIIKKIEKKIKGGR